MAGVFFPILEDALFTSRPLQSWTKGMHTSKAARQYADGEGENKFLAKWGEEKEKRQLEAIFAVTVGPLFLLKAFLQLSAPFLSSFVRVRSTVS